MTNTPTDQDPLDRPTPEIQLSTPPQGTPDETPHTPVTKPSRLRTYFLTGIFVTAPVTITLYIAYILLSKIDSAFRNLIPAPYQDLLVYENFTIPGVGLIIALVGFIVIGWFASNIMGKFFIRIGEFILDRIPVIRNLYGTIKQIFETITKTQSQAFREVVMLEYPRKGIWSIGFVTGRSKGEVEERTKDETVNVFVPTTPNPTSGFLLFVPEKDLKFLDMSVEEGIKLVVSAGIITPPHTKGHASPSKKKTLAD